MMSKGPKLDMKDLKQQAAMPLASFLRFDPWTDQVFVLHSAYEPLLTAADKMPFEVEPVYLKLSYYKAPAASRRLLPLHQPPPIQPTILLHLHRNAAPHGNKLRDSSHSTTATRSRARQSDNERLPHFPAWTSLNHDDEAQHDLIF